ncbi:zinc finger MYM-type protein 4-like isoform X2 [Gasterosteus aculeatus]
MSKDGEEAPQNTHEERLSRVFDEVMGLGDFADSSSGSASSSQDEAKGGDETSGQGECQPVEEEDTNDSSKEEKMDEGAGESSLPRTSSPSTVRPSSFSVGTTERGGVGGAACDDALDGLPVFGPEEDDEVLPIDSLEDANVGKKAAQQDAASNATPGEPSVGHPIEEAEVEEEVEEEEEQQERGGSTGSANTSHSSKDHTLDNSRDEGVLNQTEETEDSQEGDRSEAAPMEDSNPAMSPTINIKDEPIDEGYDKALLPQSSIRQIKEELENQEEELRISSVYSVGGGSTFTSPTVGSVSGTDILQGGMNNFVNFAVNLQERSQIWMTCPTFPAPVPAPPTTAIFIPGRGTVLQGMAPFPLRPPAPITSSMPPLIPAPPRPPLPSVPGSVRCSGCSKVLLKGQTAFQRKGSTQLFCSTVCLTGHLPAANKNRSCFQCNREILQPRDTITIPGDENNTVFNFCGQFCLSVFRHKKKPASRIPEKRIEKKPEKPPEKPAEQPTDKPVCSVCRVSNKQIEHEVTHQGRLHRLCSDACFVTWRKMRHLAMNCCEGCGLYCSSSSGACQTLTIDRSQLNFCGPTCIGTYKQNCKKTVECAYCHKVAIVSFTIMERDQKGKVQLYCSSPCVERSRPPRHVLTGTSFPCCLCKVTAVPQYHLAMVDGTIRNFCSYDCVTIYRKSGITSQPDLINGTSVLKEPSIKEAPKPGPSAGASSVPPVPQGHPSSVPYQAHHLSHTSVPPLVPPYPTMSSPSVPGQAQARAPAGPPLKPAEVGLSDTSKLTCHQCSKRFNTKPLLFSHQGHISMFCSKTCCEQYKTQKKILIVCEFCKQEKVFFDTMNYNQQDLIFCGESCKQLFKQDLTSRNKDHPWRPCAYCYGISQKMLHSHYGGRLEEFCRPHCMSQFTVLYYGMGRCDTCRKQGYMAEKLQCLGSVRNFCNLPCLQQYCYLHFEASRHTSSNGTGTAPQTSHAPTQPHHSSKMNPVIADVVSLANGSASQPSVSADTALTGSLPTSNVDGKNLDHASTQTDAMRVPMPRRRQMKNKSVLCRPFTMDQESMCQLPTPFDDSMTALTSPSVSTSAGQDTVKVVVVPVPVPIFIPVPMNMYSQHTPVPMAIPVPLPVPIAVPPQKKQMKDASVQSEPVALEDEKPKDGPGDTADQCSSFNTDKSQGVTPVMREEEDTEKAVQADLPRTVSEGSVPTSALPQHNTQPKGTTTTSHPPSTGADPQAPCSPLMDLETDIPNEPSDQTSSAPRRGVKRPREGYSGRKRGRRRSVTLSRSPVVTPAAPKLNHLYGVKAWRSWVQQQNKLPRQSNLVDIKEDVLQCNSAELSFALSHFIRDVRRPNGETYSPDSIFYLCLGIQQYLFMKGRIENIFTDELYSQFAARISGMLSLWKPRLLPGGGVTSSRVVESYLWECKQLGAYSPIVLLNTLLFFCTKHFGFTTLAQHQSLSFTNFTRHSKPGKRAAKVDYLRYHRGGTATPHAERSRKRKGGEAEDHELLENVANPLHCPVRLYEFYLSRCPESVKTRTDVFFLQPEQLVHTNSSHWYTSQPLDATTLQNMLTRISAVREVHQHLEQEAARHPPSVAPDNGGLQ